MKGCLKNEGMEEWRANELWAAGQWSCKTDAEGGSCACGGASLLEVDDTQQESPSGANWETAQQYMKLRAASAASGKVPDELMELFSDDVQFHIKGVFSTTSYKGKDKVKKYLSQKAEARDVQEKTPAQDSKGKITVYSEAKKVGSWWSVKAIFTFNADGKI